MLNPTPKGTTSSIVAFDFEVFPEIPGAGQLLISLCDAKLASDPFVPGIALRTRCTRSGTDIAHPSTALCMLLHLRILYQAYVPKLRKVLTFFFHVVVTRCPVPDIAYGATADLGVEEFWGEEVLRSTKSNTENRNQMQKQPQRPAVQLAPAIQN